MPFPARKACQLAVFCSLATFAPLAQAYLDPSTGSMILSAVVGLFATVGLAVKTYWYRLRNLLTGRTPPRRAAGSEPGKTQVSEDQTSDEPANRPS